MSASEPEEPNGPQPSETARRRVAAMASLISPEDILAETRSVWPDNESTTADPETSLALLIDGLASRLQQRKSQRESRRLVALDELEAVDGMLESLNKPPETAPVEAPPAELEPAPDPFATAAEVQAAYADQGYNAPSFDLLDQPVAKKKPTVSAKVLEKQKRVLQDTIDSFGIDALVTDYVPGPRITLFRVRPAEGVRVESITSISNNIAMALEAETVRMEAPIPGEPFVGIEIPNTQSAIVPILDMLTAPEWANSKAVIPLALGLDIRGRPTILDLSAAPHLLIAGATGSGKSVCMNAIILSLIYRFSPADLRLVLVDPKIVEMSVYGKLPHLITPVVTMSDKVVSSLKWAIREMERRYQVLAEKGARNIATFNAKVVEETGDPKHPDRLPFIVVIIDELADIMLTARADVETSLARIAQLSRAVGIHTVVATQRPSVDVITGVIKANYPSRIAFQVSSQIDSRTILDGKGAEALTGKGDMLFAPPGVGRLQRLQGTFVSDNECHRVVETVSEGTEQVFDKNVLTSPAGEAGAGGGDDEDSDEELIAEAIDIIRRDRRASTSYLQRTMRIGYNRAARIMDVLEQRGVVGPTIGSNPREVY